MCGALYSRDESTNLFVYEQMDRKWYGLLCVLPWLTMTAFVNIGGWIADTLVSRGLSITAVRKWDALSDQNPVQEVGHIACGSHPRNYISVLRRICMAALMNHLKMVTPLFILLMATYLVFRMLPMAMESGDTLKLRKGAWDSEEDTLLRKCIEKYGEGKWHLVPQRAGLNRCRKSCRLRWLNYLRPTLMRGNFAADEVDLMLRPYKLLENRQARRCSME